MKTIQILSFILIVISSFVISSCNKDEEQFFLPLENCSTNQCTDKSCATMVTLQDKVRCQLTSNNDVDWYKVSVTQDDVNNNFGHYGFNFTNNASELVIDVELFKDGIASGHIIDNGGNATTYAPGDDKVGGITFVQPGDYYIKVSRISGKIKDETYRIYWF